MSNDFKIVKAEWRPISKVYITNCDVCGKEIIGINNFINAGDKVVCSEDCKQQAIADFRHFENTKLTGVKYDD